MIINIKICFTILQLKYIEREREFSFAMKHFTYVLARGPVVLSSIESTRATLFETNTWLILPWNYWEEEKCWKEGQRKKERRRTDRLSASDTRFNNSRLLVDSKCRISENSPPLSLLFSGSLRSRSVKPHVKIWSRLFHYGWRFLLPYDAFDDRRSHLPCMHIDFFVFFPISHVISISFSRLFFFFVFDLS